MSLNTFRRKHKTRYTPLSTFRFLEFIKQLLFGKKRFYEDPILGTFDTRVKSDNPSIARTWSSEYSIPHQKAKTVFILEGNVNSPDKRQLESAHRVVAELATIVTFFDKKVQANPQMKNKYKQWNKEFYLAAVMSYNKSDNLFKGSDTLELNFEPVDQDDLRYIMCLWQNGTISEIEVK